MILMGTAVSPSGCDGVSLRPEQYNPILHVPARLGLTPPAFAASNCREI
jgi:hypothetical protein